VKAGQVAGLNIAAANGKTINFLQIFASGSAYLVCQFWILVYQLTGANPLHRFYSGGSEILRLSEQSADCCSAWIVCHNCFDPATASASRRVKSSMLMITLSGPAYCDGIRMADGAATTRLLS